jgi:hypothetical protein
MCQNINIEKKIRAILLNNNTTKLLQAEDNIFNSLLKDEKNIDSDALIIEIINEQPCRDYICHEIYRPVKSRSNYVSNL